MSAVGDLGDPEAALVEVLAMKNDLDQVDQMAESIRTGKPIRVIEVSATRSTSDYRWSSASLSGSDFADADRLGNWALRGGGGSRQAIGELAGTIQNRNRAMQILDPPGPAVAAKQLHPWVWSEAEPPWRHGLYRDAVQAAATRIFDVELPGKLGISPTKDPADLFSAFNTDLNKKPEAHARLRFPKIDPDDAVAMTG